MPALPQAGWWLPWAAALLPAGLAAWHGRRRGPVRHWAATWLGFGLGVAWAVWQGQVRLDDGLASNHHDVVSRLAVRVIDLPQGDASQWRFMAETDARRPAGIPERIAVSWRAPPGASLPALLPGQVWRMALVLRHPHGARNPHGYDAEARLFALGIRATATVRGVPALLRDEPWSSAGVIIERIRHHVRKGMRKAMGERRYAPVLIALAMGDQAAVAREDWQIFNRSGITHLVSISGMHVTLIAGLGGALAASAWRRARWRSTGLPEMLPAQVVGAAAALVVALLYCLLAGWGVPARRTFFMLAVVALAAIARLPLCPSRILALAAAAVAVFDPWAVLAPGFWLSFGAVAILLRAAASASAPHASRRPGWQARLGGLLREFGHVQMAITLGLVPLLAYLLQQVSLASPLANVFAIPIVSFLVTPLALLCAAFAAVPGLAILAQVCGIAGHAIFEWTMVPVAWIGASRWAVVDVAAAPWPLTVLALAGVAWALQPPGWPVRAAGWLLMLPMLCWRPDRPSTGHWTVTALDVGQGSAVVIETATQAWLFDTGPRHGEATDAGARAVVPFLRVRGHRRLDGLVVSHADLDHAGGLASVLAAVPVELAYASFDLAGLLRRQADPAGGTALPPLPASVRRCQAGQAWQVDGVAFRFLHPAAGANAGRGQGNAQSCVLLLQGRSHAVLLPGDIGAAQERWLAPHLPPIDLVLAPHHGSATSSSADLVQATAAAHVIAQAGHLNRFGHPSPQVQARWQHAGAMFWRTDRHGAVTVASSPAGLAATAQVDAARRYWHRASP
ncbi:DNA internalization-related competence protein ComEC/Rec2 [Bordetella sp. BOR01]|uniref:DNA internalization-related competence protein ComEC/Rec2 n=1 Tax=Bordetella sp. BOR01 TaxID=2854779 RepID=UPI001C45DF7D|nr:DNA internalization-related competence protein ComEC/Rec2 [Bordetella sp. BOR01]MBV7485674.1 DNA internalization-related competence protein ComEC/Rec2 [Bordetella sp. BOR01]